MNLVWVRSGVMLYNDDRKVVLSWDLPDRITVAVTITRRWVKVETIPEYGQERKVKLCGSLVIARGYGVRVDTRMVDHFTRRYRMVLNHGLYGVVTLEVDASIAGDARRYTVQQINFPWKKKIAEVEVGVE